MDNTGTEQRYLELMRGFSSEELERLPLEYTLYAGNLPALVATFVESGPRLDLPELDTLDQLCRELTTSMEQQLALSLPWAPPLLLLPRDRRRIRTQRQIVQQSLASKSARLHRQILQEYFFFSNFVDLMLLVQRAVAQALGGVISEHQIARYSTVSSKLVEVFQNTDSNYDRIQAILVEHGQG